jgi:hypothetical protein
MRPSFHSCQLKITCSIPEPELVNGRVQLTASAHPDTVAYQDVGNAVMVSHRGRTGVPGRLSKGDALSTGILWKPLDEVVGESADF